MRFPTTQINSCLADGDFQFLVSDWKSPHLSRMRGIVLNHDLMRMVMTAFRITVT